MKKEGFSSKYRFCPMCGKRVLLIHRHIDICVYCGAKREATPFKTQTELPILMNVIHLAEALGNIEECIKSKNWYHNQNWLIITLVSYSIQIKYLVEHIKLTSSTLGRLQYYGVELAKLCLSELTKSDKEFVNERLVDSMKNTIEILKKSKLTLKRFHKYGMYKHIKYDKEK